MSKQLNHILLIDDDKATNFLHQIVIEEHGCCQKVTSVSGAQEAIEFLTNPIEGQYPNPDFIFLDINMPGTNGWEFLKSYRNLTTEQRGQSIIIMLTTSFNPFDMEKAKHIEEVADFKNKPISLEMLDDLLRQFFN